MNFDIVEGLRNEEIEELYSDVIDGEIIQLSMCLYGYNYVYSRACWKNCYNTNAICGQELMPNTNYYCFQLGCRLTSATGSTYSDCPYSTQFSCS